MFKRSSGVSKEDKEMSIICKNVFGVCVYIYIRVALIIDKMQENTLRGLGHVLKRRRSGTLKWKVVEKTR